MNKESILKSLNEIKEKSKKRNFSQTVDLIFNLKNLNLKSPDEQIDFYATLHNDFGKKIKVCALVGPEMKEQALKVCDMVITQDQFPKYADKRVVRKLASEYNYFIAQANLMAQVAQIFGRVLGPRNKMPNPKAGCVVPPNANLAPLVEKLQKTVRFLAKTTLSFKCAIGTEKMDNEKLADNILTLYTQLVPHLPKETANIKNILVKLTMGKPVRLAL